jgi:integrase
MSPSHLLPKLQKHKAEQMMLKGELGDQYDNAHDLVFPTKSGDVQKISTVRVRFKSLVDKANIRSCTFDDLRKTYASLHVRAGVSPYLVCNIVGYKSVQTLFRFIPHQFADAR